MNHFLCHECQYRFVVSWSQDLESITAMDVDSQTVVGCDPCPQMITNEVFMVS